MKNSLKLFAVLMVLLLVISGCSGGVERVAEEESTPSESTAAESQAPAAEAEVEGETAEEAEATETAGNIELPAPPENYYYEIAMDAEGMSTNAKYWFQGNDYRMEMNSEEMGQKMIVISSEKDEALYMYYPDMKMATKISNDSSEEPMGEFMEFEPLEYDETMLDDYLKFEETTLDGEAAYYYELDDFDEEAEDGLTKVWVSKEYGILLKMEHYMNGSLAYSATVSNIQMGPFDDSLFTLPEGVQVTGF